ncbi:MAG: ATP-binding protein [Merismopediaceae bacterium]|nr:ATP-binding protein [Merismopediaceae bacterium]
MEKSFIINSSRTLYHCVSSLLLYQSVFENPIGQAFLHLLNTLHHREKEQIYNSTACLQAYGVWFKLLAANQQSWQDFLIQQILWSDNPFSRQVQTQGFQHLSPAFYRAVKHDLEILQNVYRCDFPQIIQWVEIASQTLANIIPWDCENRLSNFLSDAPDWTETLEDLADHYQQNGVGLFARYRAFRWSQGQLQGVSHPDTMSLSHLVGYETAKAQLVQNTECLLHGYPALNVLLYGSRGSGKSSLIKALLTEYGDRGLRLIEVPQSELASLPVILESIRTVPQKFILFVDDLSFEEDNESFKALKVVLEGNITAASPNLVVYATSNRRHLVREFFGDRPRPQDAEEIQAWDTVQEKLSFSDRFGLTLTFEPADQATYLEMVQHLAQQRNLNIDVETLAFRAKQWATRHNGRSGRTAKQFIDYLQGELALTAQS